jgi:hypothetical protein
MDRIRVIPAALKIDSSLGEIPESSGVQVHFHLTSNQSWPQFSVSPKLYLINISSSGAMGFSAKIDIVLSASLFR